MKATIIAISLAAIALSCEAPGKSAYVTTQANGLNYEFLDYIGPDSAMLYRCAYMKAGDSHVGAVYITYDKKHKGMIQTNWTEQEGKSQVPAANLAGDNTSDTIIRMVPETTIVTKTTTKKR